MAPTVVDPKVALDAKQQAWLKDIKAVLQLKAGAPLPQGSAAATASKPAGSAANAELMAKYKQVKAAVVAKVPEAVAADPSKRDEIKKLVEAASKQESRGLFDDALKSLTVLAETVKVAAVTAITAGDKAKYDKALPGAELKVSTLKNHPRASAIAAEIAKVEASLKAAKDNAAKNQFQDALTELAKIDTVYTSAKRDADNTDITRKAEESIKILYYNLTENQGIKAIDDAKVKDLGAKVDSLDAIIKARDWTKYNTVKPDIVTKLDVYRKSALQHGDYVGLRENALLKVKSLEADPNKDAISAEIAEIKTHLIDKAKTEYEANADPADAVNRYNKAKALLSQVSKKYSDAVAKANTGSKTKYETDRDAAKLKLKALDTAEKQPIVGKQIAAIKAKLDLAEKRAGVKKYSDSLKLVAEMVKDCDDAEKLAKQELDYSKNEKAAGDATKKLEKNPKAAFEAVEKLYTALKGHPQAAVIATELGVIQKKIEKAKTLVAA